MKKGLLGVLTTLGIAEEVPDKTPPLPSGSPPAPAPGAARSGASSAAVDPNVLKKLEDKLQAAAPPIYLTVMEQFSVLADVIPDEGTRMKAALKTSKCSAHQLVEALDQLTVAMQHAQEEFEASFQHNKTAQLAQIQQSIVATDDLIKSREAQIRAMQEELIALHATRDTNALRAQTEEQRLDGIRASFLVALAKVTERLGFQKSRVSSMREV